MKLITEILMVIICFLLLLLSISLNVRERIIDCRIAEISPDIPVWAKEECRKLNVRRT